MWAITVAQTPPTVTAVAVPQVFQASLVGIPILIRVLVQVQAPTQAHLRVVGTRGEIEIRV